MARTCVSERAVIQVYKFDGGGDTVYVELEHPSDRTFTVCTGPHMHRLVVCCYPSQALSDTWPISSSATLSSSCSENNRNSHTNGNTSVRYPTVLVVVRTRYSSSVHVLQDFVCALRDVLTAAYMHVNGDANETTAMDAQTL